MPNPGDIAMDELRKAVARDNEVNTSAVTLLKGLSERLKANADNPAAIRALAKELDVNQDRLAAAVVENTPAEEKPPTEPPTEPATSE